MGKASPRRRRRRVRPNSVGTALTLSQALGFLPQKSCIIFHLDTNSGQINGTGGRRQPNGIPRLIEARSLDAAPISSCRGLPAGLLKVTKVRSAGHVRCSIRWGDAAAVAALLGPKTSGRPGGAPLGPVAKGGSPAPSWPALVSWSSLSVSENVPLAPSDAAVKKLAEWASHANLY